MMKDSGFRVQGSGFEGTNDVIGFTFSLELSAYYS